MTRRARRVLGRGGSTPVAGRHAATVASIRAAWDEIAGPSGTPIAAVIVPADADDLLVAAEALGEVAATHLAPGSLRWLADRQDASGGPVGR